MQRFHPGHKFSAKERTADVRTEEQVDFESLLLSPLILKGLADSGFEKPSPIQLKAIPLGRCGLDLIAQAKSGTGKTCVFSVIALENVLFENPATQVLILAPTREIAVQIKDVVNAIGCHMKGLSCQAFIGGLPLDDDKKALKRCHIAVGSPGRVKNLIEKKYLKTDSIRMFILDEADKLLDENFQEQINWIFSTLPGNKQMMAFSATYPEYLANHLTRYMREPTFVRLNAADPTLQGIKQFYHVVPFYQLPHKIFQQKVEHLLRLLSKVNFHQCLLFSNFQIRAQSLSSTLCAKGWPATFIAGSQTQEKRLQAMEKLKAFQCRILISTDLTARGIDAENVNLVVNMDVPRDGETYLHRIGRAGRFGTKGVAVTFIAKGKEEEKFREIEKSIGIMMEPLPDHIPDSFMISDSLPGANQGQAKQDTVVVNVLHKNMTATTDKDESSRSLISNGKGNVSNGLNQAENHTEHKKVDLGATCDFWDTFVYENGTLSSEVTTHNSNEHSHEQVIKSGLKKNDASGKQEKSSELPSLEEFEKDFEEYLAMASTFEDLGLQDKGEGCHRKQTNCNDQVKETDDHKNKLANGYDGIDEGADKNKLSTDKASQKLYGISLTTKDRGRINGGVDDLKKDKGENIEDKIENDRDDSSDDEDEEDDDSDDVEDDDGDDEDEEEEEDDDENDDNDDDDNEDDDEDDNYEEQDEKEEEKTDQNLKCELTNDQSNNSNVLLQIYKKDKNYNDTKTTDKDGHCDSGQQPSVDNEEDKHDENATDDDDNENDGDEYHDDENNVVADDNDDVDESDEDGGDSDEIEDGDGDVNKSGGSKDNNNQQYDINYYYYNNDVGNLQCKSSTNHERYETFDGKQGHGTSQGIESCTAPCHDKSSITGHQCNGAYPADSHGNSMEYCPGAYMYHRTRLMSDYATSEGSGRSGMLSYCMTQGHHALHQGSQYLWNNMGNVGYQPSVDDECSSVYANMLHQHRETSWSNAWHNAYYQVNNAIQQFAAMNSRIQS